jgi:hypothetical protein
MMTVPPRTSGKLMSLPVLKGRRDATRKHKRPDECFASGAPLYAHACPMGVWAYLVGVGLQVLAPVNVGSPTVSLVTTIAGVVLFVVGAAIAALSCTLPMRFREV